MTSTATETDVLRAAFESFAARGAAGDPAWLRTLRHEAMARFAELGFPTTKQEEWRFTSVAPIARTPFRLASGAADVADAALAPHRLAGVRGTAVFVDGRLQPALSDLDGLPRGVEVRSLRDVLAREPQRLEPYLGRIASGAGKAFTALNAAFLEDGAVVFVAPATVAPEPVHLIFFSTASASGAPAVAHVRNLFLSGHDSQARVVESYAGAEGAVYFTNAVTEVALADGAILDHSTLQRESEAAFHVATLAVRQARASRFSDHAVNLGAALSRSDIDVLLSGEGGECSLGGLFMPRGTQHMDTHTVIDHASPHCVSRETYKGVLDGRSRGVFHGKILVREGAQKTDAYQVNKNLLLSREALVQSTPALEIRADDVKCKHGSTTGQLDPVAIFYLRSRGIGEDMARALLTYAFASDVVQRISAVPLRAAAEAELRRRLPGAGEEALA